MDDFATKDVLISANRSELEAVNANKMRLMSTRRIRTVRGSSRSMRNCSRRIIGTNTSRIGDTNLRVGVGIGMRSRIERAQRVARPARGGGEVA